MPSQVHSRARVYNRTRDTLVASAALVADSALARLVGLLGRSKLAAGEGLWLAPCNSIHTVGMRFPIDVVLLGGSSNVVGLKRSVEPYSVVWPNLRALSVLELPAETIASSLTEMGDQLHIEVF